MACAKGLALVGLGPAALGLSDSLLKGRGRPGADPLQRSELLLRKLLPGDLSGIADGYLAAVHGFLERWRTLHLDGMVILHRILTHACHLGDLCIDSSPWGRILPNGI